LLGYGGNDILVGEAGNDILLAWLATTSYLEVLVAIRSQVVLVATLSHGGAGADRFVFSSRLMALTSSKTSALWRVTKFRFPKLVWALLPSTNSVTYNNTGALSFRATQFATLENKLVSYPISILSLSKKRIDVKCSVLV
jgi:Ca2+-binding RTX toxin-like protein